MHYLLTSLFSLYNLTAGGSRSSLPDDIKIAPEVNHMPLGVNLFPQREWRQLHNKHTGAWYPCRHTATQCACAFLVPFFYHFIFFFSILFVFLLKFFFSFIHGFYLLIQQKIMLHCICLNISNSVFFPSLCPSSPLDVLLYQAKVR